ncbi:MAG: dimethylsulfonioproprionate lyase family protein [Pseudomonadota bacterium]
MTGTAVGATLAAAPATGDSGELSVEAATVGPLPAEDMSPAPTSPRVDLKSVPDWGYLFREIYEMYRHSSAGGSAKIRSHQRSVREVLSKTLETNPELRFEQPESKPVCAHLKRALDEGRLERTASVIRAIESVEKQLCWRYGYDKMPKSLSAKFAYAEFMGPVGPAVTNKLILGLVLFAPRTTYPAHSHDGITESYFVLSGSVSENDDGVFAPGSLIFNPPGRNHRITTGDHEPSLLAYAWIGPEDKLRDQKMIFSRTRPAPSNADAPKATRRAKKS